MKLPPRIRVFALALSAFSSREAFALSHGAPPDAFSEDSELDSEAMSALCGKLRTKILSRSEIASLSFKVQTDVTNDLVKMMRLEISQKEKFLFFQRNSLINKLDFL
jgi:hypothetical protein